MDSPGTLNLEASRALVDELACRGVRHAVVCPGSRSTPLAIAIWANPSLRLWVLVDERSAAFFALGMAREQGEPVALLSTSGTAAANFLPAMAEARLSRVPLIALTADRPPEVRGWSAAQTIDQIQLYGSHVKWFADMPVPHPDGAVARQFRAAANRAVQTALSAPMGPVHLNCPFREPLLPPTEHMPDWAKPAPRAEGVSHCVARGDPTIQEPRDSIIESAAATIAQHPRGLIVCGPCEDPDIAAPAARLGTVTGYPVLADALSGVRFGAHDRSGVIDAYDPLLRLRSSDGRLGPDVIIRVGAIPTSKPLLQFLAAHPGREHVLIDPGEPRDPDHLATTVIRANAAVSLNRLAERVEQLERICDPDWLATWRAADRAIAGALDHSLLAMDELFEGRAVAEVASLLPDDATMVVGNSMPVRDVDAFVRGDNRRLLIRANRGANGIDGVVSSALGAAAVAPGPVVLLIGDLSFHHDLNGLLAASRFGLSITIVVLNNDGGGIFSFLPQAEQLASDVFETLFGTPIGLDVAAAARLYGARYARPDDWCAFRRDVLRAIAEPGLSIVEVVTERNSNVDLHRRTWRAADEALRAVKSHPLREPVRA